MYFVPFIVGLAGLAAAQLPSPSASTSTLAQRCVTQSGPKSRPLPLETRTKRSSLIDEKTSTITSTPTVTFVPSVVTDTTVVNLTLTSTATESGATDILTITQTQSATAVFTLTATNISTSYTIEYFNSTTSITISPTSGFVPIQTIISLADHTPGKRDRIYARAKKPAAQMVVQDDGTIVTTPKQYPNRVQCLVATLITITNFEQVVGDPFIVSASPSTTQVTATSTISAFATVIGANATEIVTETAVVTVSSTVTATQSTSVVSTTTSTIYFSSPTPYYAACGPQNIASSVDGAPIGRLGVKNVFGVISAKTPYDCCVKNVQDNYAGSFFQKGVCFLISQASPLTCDPTEQAFTFQRNGALDMSDAIVISNGNCGQGQLIEPAPPTQIV